MASHFVRRVVSSSQRIPRLSPLRNNSISIARCSAEFSANFIKSVPNVATPSSPFNLSALRRLTTSASKLAIQEGHTVTVEYVTKLNDGSVFDQSKKEEPLQFQVGSSDMLPELSKAVLGLEVDDSVEFHVPPEDCFGVFDEAMVIQVPISNLPEGTQPKAEMMVTDENGNKRPCIVTAIDGDTATVDFNHPMCGRSLTFSVKVLSYTTENPELVHTVLSAGDGKTFPSVGDHLTMHYTGTLATTGEKFDSSVDRGEPFSFQIGVGQVIEGWDTGVMKMSVGEKARLEIPSSMAYRSQAVGPIPANSDLVFEVELLQIN